MLTVTVHVTGLDNVQERLTRLGTSFMDFTEALTSLGKALITFYESTVFDTEGQALFGKWVDLAPSTEAYKSKFWPGRGMLERTGHLKESFFDDVSPVMLYISNNAKTNEGADLFAIHQLGATGAGRSRSVSIPARKMLGVNSTVEDMIRATIEEDIRAKIDTTMR